MNPDIETLKVIFYIFHWGVSLSLLLFFLMLLDKAYVKRKNRNKYNHPKQTLKTMYIVHYFTKQELVKLINRENHIIYVSNPKSPTDDLVITEAKKSDRGLQGYIFTCRVANLSESNTQQFDWDTFKTFTVLEAYKKINLDDIKI